MSASPTPELTLPTWPLLMAAIGAPAVAAAAWAAVTILGPWDMNTSLIGLLAIGVVACVAVAITLSIRPWKSRAIVTWGSVLIAASMGRIVITIGICLLLYSAARLPAGPLLIGAMAGLFTVLVAETSIVAKHFQRDAA